MGDVFSPSSMHHLLYEPCSMVSRMSLEPTGPDTMQPSFFCSQLLPKPQETAKHLLSGADAPKVSKHTTKVQSGWSCLLLEEVHVLFYFQKQSRSTEYIKSNLVYNFVWWYIKCCCFEEKATSWFHWNICKKNFQSLFCVSAWL